MSESQWQGRVDRILRSHSDSGPTPEVRSDRLACFLRRHRRVRALRMLSVFPMVAVAASFGIDALVTSHGAENHHSKNYVISHPHPTHYASTPNTVYHPGLGPPPGSSHTSCMTSQLSVTTQSIIQYPVLPGTWYTLIPIANKGSRACSVGGYFTVRFRRTGGSTVGRLGISYNADASPLLPGRFAEHGYTLRTFFVRSRERLYLIISSSTRTSTSTDCGDGETGYLSLGLPGQPNRRLAPFKVTLPACQGFLVSPAISHPEFEWSRGRRSR